MRPDPGTAVLERILAEQSPEDRARIAMALRERGFLLVWDQVDRAAPMSKVEEAMFVLERLYPEMPAAHRDSIRRQISADHAAGTWVGFVRPIRSTSGATGQ